MIRTIATIMALTLATSAVAGDVKAGKKTYKKCKACHSVISDDGDVLAKGGKSGPNLYGIVGRVAGSLEGYKYSKDLMAAGAAGLVWDEASLEEWVKDPKKFLQTYLDNGSAKSKMSSKLKKGGDDVVAFLASLGPVVEENADAQAEDK